MNPLHFRQCIPVSIQWPPPAPASVGFLRTRERQRGFYRKPPGAVKRIVPAQRRRTMIKAKQPANRPPPRIVIAKLKNALALPAGWVPYRRSRTPPCTISTERVVRDPMPNHQINVLTSLHPSPAARTHEHGNGRTQPTGNLADHLSTVKDEGLITQGLSAAAIRSRR